MKRPTEDKISALVASKQIENIKIAFNLADDANCKELKAFKKKYFGKKNKKTLAQNIVKLGKLLTLVAGFKTEQRFFKVAKALIKDFGIDCYQHNPKQKSDNEGTFRSLVDKRLTANMNLTRWAIYCYKEDLRCSIDYKDHERMF